MNPDYSQSCDNLCNPPQVLDLLTQYQGAQKALDAAKAQIPKGIMDECIKAEEEVKRLHDEIKRAIEQYGSYQDIEVGVYAVKYRRMHKEYHVEPFKKHYPQYTSVVVTETINVKALEGLIKGRLLNEDELKHISKGVITETPQYAFFIR